MKLIRNPELKGILTLFLIIVILGGLLAVTTGKLEQWFGITWGAKAFDSIAFVSDRSGPSDIWLVDADGSDLRRVTTGVGVGSFPSVSANGSRILFVGVQGNELQIMSVHPDGKRLERMSSSGSVALPTFSPDGKKSAYIANGKVYVCEVGGGSPEAVLPTEAEIHAAMTNTLDRSQLPPYTCYAWGPNSESMAGITRDPSEDDVLVFIPESKGKPQMVPARALMNGIIRQTSANTELPDGVQIKIKNIVWASRAKVFTIPIVLGDNEASSLVTFKVEGGKLRVADFKPVPGVITGLALSPDGSKLACSMAAVTKGMPNGVVIVDLKNQSGGLVAKGNFMSLSYSPGGDRLVGVQVSPRGNKRDVVTIDPDDGKVTKITKDGHSFNPAWTPVSKK